jgi:hypothetical protein
MVLGNVEVLSASFSEKEIPSVVRAPLLTIVLTSEIDVHPTPLSALHENSLFMPEQAQSSNKTGRIKKSFLFMFIFL